MLHRAKSANYNTKTKGSPNSFQFKRILKNNRLFSSNLLQSPKGLSIIASKGALFLDGVSSPQTTLMKRNRKIFSSLSNFSTTKSLNTQPYELGTQITVTQTDYTNSPALTSIKMLELKYQLIDPLYSLDCLQNLFKQRCIDMNLPQIKDQWLRFLDKFHNQSRKGALNLQELLITPNCLQGLINIILQSQQLEDPISQLNLNFNRIKDEGTIYLAQHINFTQLVSLKISNCLIGPIGFQALFTSTKGNNHLIHLDVGNSSSRNRNRLGQQAIKALSELISTSDILQILGLNFCGITKEMLNTLNEAFQINQSLIEIQLARNEFQNLKEQTVTISSNLEKINLNGNKMGAEAIVYLSEYFKPHFNTAPILFINLADNKINSYAFSKLCEAITKNSCLKVLILDNNILCGDNFSIFEFLLQTNNILTHLSLKNCQIGLPFIQALTSGLQRNNRLAYLNLSKNQIQEQEMECFSTVFEKFQTGIQFLKMKRCGIVDEYAERFFKSLQNQSQIKHLDLSQNLISDKSAIYAVEAVKNSKIIFFQLYKNPIQLNLLEEIQLHLKLNNQKYLSQMIPELLNQVAQIQDYERLEKILQEDQKRVYQSKKVAETQLDNLKLNKNQDISDISQQTKQIEQQYQKLKSEYQYLQAEDDKIDELIWNETMKLEKNHKDLKNQIKDENFQSSTYQNQIEETKSNLYTYGNNYKIQVEKLKYKLDQAQKSLSHAEIKCNSIMKLIQMEQEIQKKKGKPKSKSKEKQKKNINPKKQ